MCNSRSKKTRRSIRRKWFFDSAPKSSTLTKKIAPCILLSCKSFPLQEKTLAPWLPAARDFGNPRERRSRECSTYLIDKFSRSSVLATGICRSRFGVSRR